MARNKRNVKCCFCGEQMVYHGEAGHEPEVSIQVENCGGDNNFGWLGTFYAHVRCYNEWQKDKVGSKAGEGEYGKK